MAINIEYNLEQVGLYFKDKIQKGDYVLLDNNTPYSRIEIDGEYEFLISGRYIHTSCEYYCHLATNVMFIKYISFNKEEAKEVVINLIDKKEKFNNEINKSNIELQIEYLQEQLKVLNENI